ncbi:phage tail assembly chaperone [Cupriavidus sp. Marseille-Q8015]
MFKVNPNPTFAVAVQIAVPGRPAEALKLVFRHKPRADVKSFCDRVVAASRESGVVDSGKRDAELLQEIVAGWEDVDEPFSIDALARLLENYHTASQAIFDAYTEALTTARRGN